MKKKIILLALIIMACFTTVAFAAEEKQTNQLLLLQLKQNGGIGLIPFRRIFSNVLIFDPVVIRDKVSLLRKPVYLKVQK